MRLKTAFTGLLLLALFNLFGQDTISPRARVVKDTSLYMPTSGELVLDPSWFDRGSSDDFTPKDKLRFSLHHKSKYLNRGIVECEDFECAGANDKYFIDYIFIVTDEQGNADSVKFLLRVVDSKDVCPNFALSGARFRGKITALESGEPLEDVVLGLDEFEGVTDHRGKYEIHTHYKYNFCERKPGWNNVRIEAQETRKQDFLAGVSAADLYLIRKFLLGLTEFETTMEFFAADVDNSDHVSAHDMAVLRKCLLGETMDFGSNNPSWRIVPKESFDSTNINNPRGELKPIYVNNTQSTYGHDFWGIKIGDVNRDFYKYRGGHSTREKERISMQVRQINDNTLAFIAQSDWTLSCFQASLSIQSQSLIRVEPHVLDISSNQYFSDRQERLNIVWDDQSGSSENIQVGDILFYITGDNIELKQNGQDPLRFRSMAYDEMLIPHELTFIFENIELPHFSWIDQNTLRITSSMEKPTEFSITNVLGQNFPIPISTQNCSANSCVIKLPFKKHGVYYLRYKVANNTFSQPLIISGE